MSPEQQRLKWDTDYELKTRSGSIDQHELPGTSTFRSQSFQERFFDLQKDLTGIPNWDSQTRVHPLLVPENLGIGEKP